MGGTETRTGGGGASSTLTCESVEGIGVIDGRIVFVEKDLLKLGRLPVLLVGLIDKGPRSSKPSSLDSTSRVSMLLGF